MKPLPQSVHDRAELLARVHSLSTVAEILRIKRHTVTAMKRRGWKAIEHRPMRPLPSDWQIQARHMSSRELRAYYRTSSVTVARWKRECPVRRCAA